MEKKGVEYTLFSCLKAAEGGMAKRDAIEILRDAGIKVLTEIAYSQYVGHYGLWVEEKKRNKASKLLFGS